MRDQHILSYVGSSLWAITPEKWAQMLPALVRHVKGDKLSADELAAFMGDKGQPPASASKRGVVAVIPIRGVIAHRMDALDESSGGTSAERIGKMLKAMAADDSIGTIVYDIDSPGGTVPGIRELAQQMFELRSAGKKQIAVSNSLAASAAYWLASQADEIVSIPSGYVGSIGVFSAHQDLSAALEKEGIRITLIKAGKFKTENNPFEPLTDEGRAEIQKRVDDAYGHFTKDVARGRGVSASDVKNGFGEGRTLMAKDAKAAGLIDRIATLDEVIGKLVGKSTGSGPRASADHDAELADAMAAGDVDRANELLLNGGATETPKGVVSATPDELRQRLERF